MTFAIGVRLQPKLLEHSPRNRVVSKNRHIVRETVRYCLNYKGLETAAGQPIRPGKALNISISARRPRFFRKDDSWYYFARRRAGHPVQNT